MAATSPRTCDGLMEADVAAELLAQVVEHARLKSDFERSILRCAKLCSGRASEGSLRMTPQPMVNFHDFLMGPGKAIYHHIFIKLLWKPHTSVNVRVL
jgi:hypothetical protein